MAKKRIIQLPEALEYADDAVIAIDDAVNGTQKLPLSEVIGGGGSGSSVPTINVPVFTPMWFDHECPSDAWMFSPQAYSQGNGYGWKTGSDFPKAYDHLVKDLTGASSVTETVAGVSMTFFRAADGHQVIVADGIADSGTTSADELFTACGVSWFYVLDKTNQRFRLPRTRYSLQGMKDGGSVEKYDAAGLPNITGKIDGSAASSEHEVFGEIFVGDITVDGCFEDGIITGTQYPPTAAGPGSIHMIRGFKFDASKSNTIYGSSATVQPPATEMYLYFSSGIENDVVGGGVIDGSKYLLSNDSTEYITDVTIDTTGTLLYTVENDCQLYIETPFKDYIIWNRLYVYINDVDNSIWSLNDSHAGVIYKSTTIPIKSGSKIYAKFLSSGATVSNCAFKFIEYKLNSLNPQVAFPDWDESKAVTINNGDTIPNNGWIVFQVDDSTVMGSNRFGRAYINGIEVYYWSWEQGDGDNNTNTTTVPVCKGDVLTYTDASGRMSCTFYPAKSVPVTKSEKADLEQKITELSGTVAEMLGAVALKSELEAHSGDDTIHITQAERFAWNAKADASQLPSKQDVIVQEGYLYVPDRDVDGRWHRMQAYYDSDMEGVTTTCGDENYVRDAGGNFILEA